MLGIKSDFNLNFYILLDDFCGLLALYEPCIILKVHIRLIFDHLNQSFIKAKQIKTVDLNLQYLQ